MIVENQMIEIKGSMISKYISKGYTHIKGEPFYVHAEDLLPQSHKKIRVICDYCGKEFEMHYFQYYSGTLNGLVKKCACHDCLYQKIMECNLIRYGVEHTASLPETREKYKNTCIEKYGVDNVNKLDSVKAKKVKKSLEKYGTINVFQSMEVKNKSKATIRKKYGVDHAMELPEIRKKIQNSVEYVNGRPVSAEQKRIANLFSGELNYKLDRYRLDIMLEHGVVIEYDGPGHDLHVKIGRVSQDDFDRSEEKKKCRILEEGFKLIRFIHRDASFVSDDEYILILKECMSCLTIKQYIEYDLDKKQFLLN